MFVGVARLVLQIPDSGSLKSKRQVLRRVTDRVKAKFNVSVSEVDDQDAWQKATVALCLVASEKRHCVEQLDKVIHFIEEMYVAPLVGRQTEILSFGDELYAPGQGLSGSALQIDQGQRSLAEAEGLQAWEDRQPPSGGAPPAAGARATPKPRSLDEARERARRLRNPRDWEKDR